MTPTDALLRRIEITAAVVCTAIAGVTLVLARGNAAPALAVLAGGVLVAVSYYTIKSATHTLAAAMAGGADAPRARRMFAWTVARVALRYALLAFLAYVMIARLRLHPLALLAGASSLVAAIALEAVRFLVKKKS